MLFDKKILGRDRGGEKESEGVCGGLNSQEDRQSLKQRR